LGAVAAVSALTACSDSTGNERPQPTSIEVAGAAATSAAGLPLATSPTFVVKDQNGAIMGGVAVSATVTAGGGTITGAPTTTVAGGPTSVGAWTLGSVTGTNALAIAVQGLPAQTITVIGVAGAPAKLTAQTATTLAGTVGEAVTLAPRALLTDAFDNPIAGSPVTLVVTGGGTAGTSAGSDPQGVVAVPSWTLGTVKGVNVLTLTAGTASLAFTATAAAGAPAALTLVNGAYQTTYGGRAVPAAVQFALRDRYENGIGSQTVSFTAIGGGTVDAVTATTAEDGSVTAPAWRLGKSVVPQQLRASAGPLSANADATVRTSMNIIVRFFGTGMTDAEQALFTTAAARLSAILTGDLPDVAAVDLDLASACDVSGQPPMNETIDDVVIYASIEPIDGPGRILAQAGPCAFRSDAEGVLPAIGSMQFDDADLAMLAGEGSLQDVIMHEMMHVLGFSAAYFDYFGYLADRDLSTVAYLAPNGLAGCRAVGGTATCASSVPLENTGGAGTANSHWRESVFDDELMTGYANSGVMPISQMTVGAFADLGYQVNYDAQDSYAIPGGSVRASASASTTRVIAGGGWERPLPRPGVVLTRSGAIRLKAPLSSAKRRSTH